MLKADKLLCTNGTQVDFKACLVNDNYFGRSGSGVIVVLVTVACQNVCMYAILCDCLIALLLECASALMHICNLASPHLRTFYKIKDENHIAQPGGPL